MYQSPTCKTAVYPGFFSFQNNMNKLAVQKQIGIIQTTYVCNNIMTRMTVIVNDQFTYQRHFLFNNAKIQCNLQQHQTTSSVNQTTNSLDLRMWTNVVTVYIGKSSVQSSSLQPPNS